MICNRFDVVKVPFPFTDKQSSKVRPALVLSNTEFNKSVGKTVLAMITSSTKVNWLHDTIIADLNVAGLSAPSRARMKIFTIDNALVLLKLGRLAEVDCDAFEKNYDKLR